MLLILFAIVGITMGAGIFLTKYIVDYKMVGSGMGAKNNERFGIDNSREYHE